MARNTMKKDKELPPELYHIAREKGTEPSFTGKYWNIYEQGVYKCAVCGAPLFSSETKFDSGTGWPSFTNPIGSEDPSGSERPMNLEHIELKEDMSEGMSRTEVLCKNCKAHLGHVFEDGPKDKGGKRYCINSVCLALEKKEE